jgi:hypothetical protein
MLRVPILTAGPGRDARGTGVPRPWRSNWTSRSSSAACILAQRSRTHTASGVANTFHTVIDHTYVDAVSKVVLQPGQSFLDAEYTNGGCFARPYHISFGPYPRLPSVSIHRHASPHPLSDDHSNGPLQALGGGDNKPSGLAGSQVLGLEVGGEATKCTWLLDADHRRCIRHRSSGIRTLRWVLGNLGREDDSNAPRWDGR